MAQQKLTTYIETILDEWFIMSEYTNISTSVIKNCVINNKSISNPLRIDKKPSATFTIGSDNKLRLVDFAQSIYGGDIYSVVGVTLGLNSNNPKHFITICNNIIDNLIINKTKLKTYTPTQINKSKYKLETVKPFTKIVVEYDDWNNKTFQYWWEYVKPNKELAFLLLKELQYFDIYPVKAFYLRNNLKATRINKNQNIYAYLLKIDKSNRRHYKIYLPNDSKKFYTNGTDTINYLHKVDNAEIGVLTKSIKDAIILNTLAKYLKVDDTIKFVPISSESSKLSNEDVYNLNLKFNKIYTFFDWDEAGLKGATICYFNYDYESIFITNKEFIPIATEELVNVLKQRITYDDFDLEELESYYDMFKLKENLGAKDFSDYIKIHSLDKTIKFFKTIFKKL